MKNVILITLDAMRKDVFGCYGAKTSCIPFLDSLQENCIRFSNAFSTGPYTQASFPGVLTSSYYLEYGKQKRLPSQKTLISEVLKSKGITTAAFHSNPYLSAFFGYNRGWDVFYDSMEDEVSDVYPFIRGNHINNKVAGWLGSHVKANNSSPFFLWVHYMDIHEPYVPEKEYLQQVDSSIDIDKQKMLALFKDVLLKRDVSNKQTVDLLRKLYNAKVLEVDYYLKEIFQTFKNSGILEDSVIIIGSDHGDEFDEHGGLSHDGKMYSELVGVPLFIFEQGRENAEVYQPAVSNIDIAPTIASLFGIENVESFKGSSLLPLEGYSPKACCGEGMNKRGNKEKETDRPIYYYLEENMKTIFDQGKEYWELYDLQQDPEESNNIVESSPKAEQLKGKLKNWISSHTRT
ncbi:MAG: sulfatase [Spirochaetota bacterium]